MCNLDIILLGLHKCEKKIEIEYKNYANWSALNTTKQFCLQHFDPLSGNSCVACVKNNPFAC
jgi:hypothetical protein